MASLCSHCGELHDSSNPCPNAVKEAHHWNRHHDTIQWTATGILVAGVSWLYMQVRSGKRLTQDMEPSEAYLYLGLGGGILCLSYFTMRSFRSLRFQSQQRYIPAKQRYMFVNESRIRQGDVHVMLYAIAAALLVWELFKWTKLNPWWTAIPYAILLGLAAWRIYQDNKDRQLLTAEITHTTDKEAAGFLDEDDGFFKRWFGGPSGKALVFGAIVFLGTIGIYVWAHRNEPFTNDPAAWGQFGDYVGGLVNPVIAIVNLAVLVYIGVHIDAANKRFEKQTRERELGFERARIVLEKYSHWNSDQMTRVRRIWGEAMIEKPLPTLEQLNARGPTNYAAIRSVALFFDEIQMAIEIDAIDPDQAMKAFGRDFIFLMRSFPHIATTVPSKRLPRFHEAARAFDSKHQSQWEAEATAFMQ